MDIEEYTTGDYTQTTVSFADGSRAVKTVAAGRTKCWYSEFPGDAEMRISLAKFNALLAL